MELPEVFNYYEMMLILKAEMPEETRGVIRSKLEDYIAENGGSIVNIEVWGKRSFAYEIDHMKEGYYLLYFFHLNPLKIKRMEKNLRVDENVVRFKVFKKELPTLTPAKAEAPAASASEPTPSAAPEPAPAPAPAANPEPAPAPAAALEPAPEPAPAPEANLEPAPAPAANPEPAPEPVPASSLTPDTEGGAP